MRVKIAILILGLAIFCAHSQVIIDPQWGANSTSTRMKTTITLQVVVNPLLTRSNPVHDNVWNSLAVTHSDLVRFVPWFPYPRYAVAALEAPNKTKTSWDFSLIDPLVEDFLTATQGKDTVINFSTTPAWMWEVDGEQPVVPKDPDQVIWDYTQGTKLIDDDFKKLGEYYGRLVSWYTNGGFKDELGVFHNSGHKFRLSHWEVLNEIESEHQMNPEYYTKIYDAVVTEIRKVYPVMKFVGMALAYHDEFDWYAYFLDPKNHAPGIPIDYISFHFYAGSPDRTVPADYNGFFPQVDTFVGEVQKIIKIRNKLNPNVKISIDEIGVILPNDNDPSLGPDIPDSYWNANGAMYAYIVGSLAPLGIDILGQSQLTGYPSQFPSVTLLDWNSGTPNARLRVQTLLHQYISIGDMLYESPTTDENVFSLAFKRRTGAKYVLVINKSNEPVDVGIYDLSKGTFTYVDLSTSSGLPVTKLIGSSFRLGGWAVGIAEYK
eukprot:TRINITY_DN1463_c0_g1_i1.p1 TRINITY_DN1463_c0_g1~~TRINITY_DN1463_c0_g1_i1.p1  ORF type:complete len:511 (+),score=124.59 TRINITY_DN1463_c0_g1_i1:66-1535(+)